MSGELLSYHALQSGVVRRGRPVLGGPPALPADTWVSGVKPSATNMGAGILRDYPTDVINGNVTVTEATGPLLDKIVNGRVIFQGDSSIAYAENCAIRGAAAAPTAVSYLASTTASTGTAANLRFCDLAPQTPSAWWNAVGTKFMRLSRCKAWNVTDAFRIYSTTVDGLVKSWFKGLYVYDLSHFSPDYGTGNRLRTHNDIFQLDGNPGGDETDLVIEDFYVNARHSTTIGDQPAPIAGLSSETCAFMLTGDVAPEINVTIRNGWADGGDFTMNAGKDGRTGRLALSNIVFEKPGTRSPGTRTAIAVDPAYTKVSWTGLVYADGTPVVPVAA